MSILVSALISRIQRSKSNCPTATALGFINDVHGEILARYPLREDVLDVNLTAETQEYALDETAIMIEVATYLLDSTQTPRVLRSFNAAEKDQMEPGWRARASSTPSSYWIGAGLTGAQIGLYPKPDTSTSSGYPLLRLKIRRKNTLAGSDTIPNGLLNGDIYVYGSLRRFCEERQLDELPVWLDRERDAFLKLETYLAQRQEQESAVIRPAYMVGRRQL